MAAPTPNDNGHMKYQVRQTDRETGGQGDRGTGGQRDGQTYLLPFGAGSRSIFRLFLFATAVWQLQ